MKRTERASLARETLEILERGGYTTGDGQRVEITQAVRTCTATSRLYLPEELDELRERILATTAIFPATVFGVRNETTLEGARRLAESGAFARVGVLNFASAKNPGGGFLSGSQAQEESLARSSALYSSLTRCEEFYNFHRGHESLLYSDRIIYSPRCPVFRQDSGELLTPQYLVDFITSPAPNAGAIKTNRPHEAPQIPDILRTRAAKVLALACEQRCDALILGAWGCGVFKNVPEMVANTFAEHLLPGRPFFGRFKEVLFSVFDREDNLHTFNAFRKAFA